MADKNQLTFEAGNVRKLVLKMWNANQEHQHPLGTC